MIDHPTENTRKLAIPKAIVPLLLYFLLCAPIIAKQSLLVGAQSIDYYPHYRFTDNKDKGYAWALLEAFSKHSGYTFTYEAYPIKRLQRELLANKIDFLYPDNPKWDASEQMPTAKIYSVALISAIGSTMVPLTQLNKGLENFKLLSVPRGFTPVKWTNLIEENQVHIVEVSDALTPLKMVILGRVDGADIEYNVAKYLLRKLGQEQTLTYDPNLPFDPITFHLSTIKQGAIMAEFSQFIAKNSHLLSQLKRSYQIIEPHQLPAR